MGMSWRIQHLVNGRLEGVIVEIDLGSRQSSVELTACRVLEDRFDGPTICCRRRTRLHAKLESVILQVERWSPR
jgi:hypothetical protein